MNREYSCDPDVNAGATSCTNVREKTPSHSPAVYGWDNVCCSPVSGRNHAARSGLQSGNVFRADRRKRCQETKIKREVNSCELSLFSSVVSSFFVRSRFRDAIFLHGPLLPEICKLLLSVEKSLTAYILEQHDVALWCKSLTEEILQKSPNSTLVFVILIPEILPESLVMFLRPVQ